MGNKNLWLTLSATFIISAMTVGITIYSLGQYETLVMKINAIHERSAVVADIKNTLLTRESSLQRYLLTSQPVFDQYASTKDMEKLQPDHLQEAQKKMRESATQDMPLLELISTLDQTITLYNASIQPILMLTTQGKFAQAGEMLVQEAHHQPMLQFKNAIDAIELYQSAQLGKLMALRDQAILWTRIATVVLGAVILSLITALIYLIDRELSTQKFYQEKLSREVQHLSAQLLEHADELADLSTHLQNSTEQEKAQLARDLHDEFGGLLTTLKIDLAWMEGRAEIVDSALAERTLQVSNRVNELIDLKRRVVENLRPSLLDNLGIEAALTWYVKDVAERAGLLLTLDIEPLVPRPGPEISIAFFRVAQEALTNTIKYAQATALSVHLKALPGKFQLRIIDNGIGMDQRERSKRTPAHGLLSMRHRTVALGGTLRIESEPGQGMTIIATVPVPSTSPASHEKTTPAPLELSQAPSL